MSYKVANYTSVKDLIDKVNSFEDTDEAVKFLKKHDNKSLRYFIDAYYNKDFTFLRGIEINHDYCDQEKGFEYSNLNNESRRLELILKIGKKNDKVLKLCSLILESIPKNDADLIKESLFNHKHVNINKKVFRKVYPEFFRSESKDEKN